jgi:hypothetical protein
MMKANSATWRRLVEFASELRFRGGSVAAQRMSHDDSDDYGWTTSLLNTCEISRVELLYLEPRMADSDEYLHLLAVGHTAHAKCAALLTNTGTKWTITDKFYYSPNGMSWMDFNTIQMGDNWKGIVIEAALSLEYQTGYKLLIAVVNNKLQILDSSRHVQGPNGYPLASVEYLAEPSTGRAYLVKISRFQIGGARSLPELNRWYARQSEIGLDLEDEEEIDRLAERARTKAMTTDPPCWAAPIKLGDPTSRAGEHYGRCQSASWALVHSAKPSGEIDRFINERRPHRRPPRIEMLGE